MRHSECMFGLRVSVKTNIDYIEERKLVKIRITRYIAALYAHIKYDAGRTYKQDSAILCDMYVHNILLFRRENAWFACCERLS